MMFKKFDKLEFINILKEEGWLKAIEYKNKYIPSILYKYFPLFDDRVCKYKQENDKRFSSLENKEIWISRYDCLNDPFEFKMFSLDKKRLEYYGWDSKKIEYFLENIRKVYFTTCFSGETENNMPLWAHYANNHMGFCVKYRVKNKKLIYPVFYEPKRVKTASILTSLISEIFSVGKNINQEPSEEFYEYFTYLFLSLCCKHQLWEYENEFRLLYPVLDSLSGKLISLSEIGLEIDSIYVGIKVKCENKQRLIEIAKKLNVNIYEMYFDDDEEEFKLHSKIIC